MYIHSIWRCLFSLEEHLQASFFLLSMYISGSSEIFTYAEDSSYRKVTYIPLKFMWNLTLIHDVVEIGILNI